MEGVETDGVGLFVGEIVAVDQCTEAAVAMADIDNYDVRPLFIVTSDQEVAEE